MIKSTQLPQPPFLRIVIIMPIYTAATIENGKPQSAEFTSRGIAGMTQSKMSNIPLYGKPDTPEIAYAGYKANIDMFLAATIEGNRLRVDTEGRGVTMTCRIPNPLAVVNVAFVFVKEPQPEGIEKMKEALKAYGMGAVALSKTVSVWTLDNIPVNLVVEKIAKLARPTCGTPDKVKGRATGESAGAALMEFGGGEIDDLF